MTLGVERDFITGETETTEARHLRGTASTGSALRHDDFIVLALSEDVYSCEKPTDTICAHGRHTEVSGFRETVR